MFTVRINYLGLLAFALLYFLYSLILEALVVVVVYYYHLHKQTSVQTILCTDGKISLGIFLFEHPDLNQLSSIEFYAGDMTRKFVRGEGNYELQAKNIFRIDGEQVNTITQSSD